MDNIHVTKAGDLIKLSDVSFVGTVDKHINHGSGNANTTYFFLVVIGGQKIEIKGKNEEETKQERDHLMTVLIHKEI